MAGGVGNILIRVGAETASAVSNLGKVNGALGDTMTTSEKMSAGVKRAAIPAAAALGVLGVAAIKSTKAALEDAAAQEKLAGVLERTTGATEAQVAASEKWIANLSLATGVADDELRPALGKLAQVTGSIADGQKYLAAALDVSAASGKDVAASSAAIAKAHEGSLGALYKMVPGLKAATKGSKDMTVVMDELARLTGGAMADSAATAEGQMRILSVQSAELKETLGAALIPVVMALLPILTKVGTIAAENTGVIKVLVGVVAVLAGGILVANAAMKAYAAAGVIVKAATVAWTAAQWLLNAALNANPIGLVIIAIAALAAGIVIAYKRSETFRDVVAGALNLVRGVVNSLGNAFDSLVSAARTAFAWIVDHWKVALFAFGPIGAAIYAIVTNFDKVKAAAGTVASVVSSAIGGIASAIESVIGAVERLIGALGRIKVPKISLPDLPGLPFSVAPSSYGLSPAAAGYASSSSSSRAGRSSSAGGVTVNVYGAIDPEGTARAIKRILASHDRRQGR